jgi:hypothetical protein
MKANMMIDARSSADSLPSKPSRITSRVTTLIANSPTASAAAGNHRCCLILSSPGNLLRLRATYETWLGIVAPGELLALDLDTILADDAPRILGETWESTAGDAVRPGLAVDRRR